MELTDLLIIVPSQLAFAGTFKHQIIRSLKLMNPHKEKSVIFKIKTTAPSLYLVRPNVAVIDPGKSVEIQIALQPFEYGKESKRHKFLVQAIYGTEPEDSDLIKLWKTIKSTDIWEVKINVLLQPEPDSTDVNTKGVTLKDAAGKPSDMNSNTVRDTTNEYPKGVKCVENVVKGTGELESAQASPPDILNEVKQVDLTKTNNEVISNVGGAIEASSNTHGEHEIGTNASGDSDNDASADIAIDRKKSKKSNILIFICSLVFVLLSVLVTYYGSEYLN